MQEAMAGDNIGFNLRGVAKTDFHRGSRPRRRPANPPTIAKEFLAQIIVVFHPTAIAAGYTPVLHAHTAQVAATITEIIAKIDPRTGQPTEEKPKTIKTGDSAIVKITPLRPVVLETFKEFPELGRFALRDMGQHSGSRHSSGSYRQGPSREGSRKGVTALSSLLDIAPVFGVLSLCTGDSLFFDRLEVIIPRGLLSKRRRPVNDSAREDSHRRLSRVVGRGVRVRSFSSY